MINTKYSFYLKNKHFSQIIKREIYQIKLILQELLIDKLNISYSFFIKIS
mgnify:CR=1 FL=1